MKSPRKKPDYGRRIGDRCDCDKAFLMPRDRRLAQLKGEGEIAYCPACQAKFEIAYTPQRTGKGR